MLKHESLKVGEVYKHVGVDYYALKCIEVSNEIVNVGYNTYAKIAKFSIEHYSPNMKEFNRVNRFIFIEQVNNNGEQFFATYTIKPI